MIIFILCVLMFGCMYVSVKVLDALELESEMVVRLVG